MSEPDFVAIPAGSIEIGETDDDKFANDTERPRVLIRCKSFLLARTPVTVGEFRLFRPHHEPEAPSNWPATNLHWHDAIAYCEWLSHRLGKTCRLPTEAEWEYACRAGTRTPYYCGSEITPRDANFWYAEDGRKVGPGHKTPVASYPPNPFGLFDMLGNVNEWVEDCWHPSHRGRPNHAGIFPGGEQERRVLRGGSWDYLPRLLRCCWRDGLHEKTRQDNIGLRVAMDA